jgi:hypothetical protein
MTTPAFTLERDARGRLVCTLADGTRHAGVLPVRAFPLSAPDQDVSLVGGDGHEVLWFARLADVPETQRRLIEEDLASREFIPTLERILSVARFVLKGEEDIRRLALGALLITDTHGLSYRVRDRFALDPHSRKLIERFL